MATHVLPKYFKHANYSSFQRQLNYFHFRKHARQKTHVCTFSNPYFQRDAPQLASQIVRKKATARKSYSATATMAPTAKIPAMARPAITTAVSRPHYKDTADGYSSPTDVVFDPVSSYFQQQQQQQTCQLTPIPFPFVCSSTNGRYTPVPVPQPPPLSLSMAAMPPSAAKEPAASMAPSSFAWLDAIYASLDAASATGDYYH